MAAPEQQVGQQLQSSQPALHARACHAAAQLRACIATYFFQGYFNQKLLGLG